MSRLTAFFASLLTRQPSVIRHSSFVIQLALLSSPAPAQLTEQKTPGVRVVYVDGTESFLLPQVTRTALNSLKFQKNIFGFDPKKDPLVLLVALSDKGNAGP